MKRFFDRNRKIIVTLLIILGCNLLFNMAESDAGIGISPTTTEIVMMPNTSAEGTYRIVNEGKEPIHVTVQVEDWLKVRTGKSPVSIEEWLTVSPMEFDIEPSGTKEVEYIIKIPGGLKGELVAMVFFGTSSLEGALNITSRIGASIYAAVKDTIKLGCEIKKIYITPVNSSKDKEGKMIDPRIIFNIEIENKGNVHLRPTGDILVKAKDGTRYDVKIERGFPAYPGQRLNYPVIWDKKDVPAGKYTAEIKLDYGALYKEDRKLERKVSFLVKKDGNVLFF